MELNDCSDYFYKQLLSNDNTESNDDNNYCLITHEPLEESIKLDCSHSFNYDAIFKYVLNQKTKFNLLEYRKYILKFYQIMCPYCRTVQNKLLPYKKNIRPEKRHGVNYIDLRKVSTYDRTCGGLKYIKLDDSLNTSFCSDDEMIGVPCANIGSYVIENIHSKDVKIYCKSCKEHALKQPEMIIHPKLNIDTNDKSINTETNICSHILLKGKNKGLFCKNKLYKNDLCKRHFIP